MGAKRVAAAFFGWRISLGRRQRSSALQSEQIPDVWMSRVPSIIPLGWECFLVDGKEFRVYIFQSFRLRPLTEPCYWLEKSRFFHNNVQRKQKNSVFHFIPLCFSSKVRKGASVTVQPVRGRRSAEGPSPWARPQASAARCCPSITVSGSLWMTQEGVSRLLENI